MGSSLGLYLKCNYTDRSRIIVGTIQARVPSQYGTWADAYLAAFREKFGVVIAAN
jgi:hypothetical protein